MDEITEFLQEVSFQDPGWIMLIPACLMGFDILTGVVHAWATGHLKSYRMREGLGRKFGEITILCIGQIFTSGMNLPSYILPAFSIYIIFMELVSICENLKKLGIPMPRFIDKALASMNDIIQNGSDMKESDDNGKTEDEQK